jgi:hypothetical protein
LRQGAQRSGGRCCPRGLFRALLSPLRALVSRDCNSTNTPTSSPPCPMLRQRGCVVGDPGMVSLASPTRLSAYRDDVLLNAGAPDPTGRATRAGKLDMVQHRAVRPVQGSTGHLSRLMGRPSASVPRWDLRLCSHLASYHRSSTRPRQPATQNQYRRRRRWFGPFSDFETATASETPQNRQTLNPDFTSSLDTQLEHTRRSARVSAVQ